MTDYIINGIYTLKKSFLPGILIYIAIIALLNLTGIFTLHYRLNGTFSYSLVPFVGSSIAPIMLNFALFFPLGFLLPFLFRPTDYRTTG